jgi:outer membrane receptor for ferric coprogen and ferric-rhodotorulic acid
MTSALSQTTAFNILGQDASTAILEFARQARLQIIAPADRLIGIRTHSVSGVMDSRSALKLLLEGTGLIVSSDDGHTISLRFAETKGTTGSTATQPLQGGADQAVVSEVVVRGVAQKYRPDTQTSATGLDVKVVDAPQAISVITGNMMDVIGAQSIYSASDLVPGAIHKGSGFGFDRIQLRGIDNAYERVNGIELNAYNYYLDAFALDRVEVVRGPATALYGVTGSFGGEINSILKRPLASTQVQVGLRTGSYDSRSYSLDVTGRIPGTGGALTGRFAGKYDDYGAPLDINIRNHKEAFLSSLSWQISPTTDTTLWWYHGNRNVDPYDQGALFEVNGRLELPPAGIDPRKWYFSNPNESTEHTEFDLLLLEWVHTLSNAWRLTADAAYTTYEQQINYFYPFGPFGAYGNRPNEASVYTYDISRHSDELTVDLSLGGEFELLGRKQSFFAALEGDETTEPTNFTLLNSMFTGVVNAYQGGEGIYANGSPMTPVNESGQPIREITNTVFKDLKGSVQLLANPADRVRVLVGVMAHRSTETNTIPISGDQILNPANEQKTAFTKIVKRLGIVYELMGKQAVVDTVKGYFNYSEGFQPQVLIDKNAIARSFPQNMKQYEAGVKSELLNGAVGGSIAVYNYTITNIPASGATIGQFGTFGTTVADGDQKATGVEAELVGEILPGWNLSANYAFTDSKITDPQYTFTTPVANIPRHKGAIASSYEFIEGPLKGFRLGGMVVASGDYAFIQGLVNVARWGQLTDGAYTRLDLNASYRGFTGDFKGLELYANLHNVLDERIAFSKEGSPSYGVVFDDQRNFALGLRYRFK